MQNFAELNYLERLRLVLLGQYPPRPPRQLPIITSICYYSFCIVAGRLLRLVAQKVCPKKYLPYVLDFIFTFQVLCCSLENGQIRKHYGMGAYALVLFTLSVWHQATTRDCKANPCAHVVNFMQGSLPLWQLLLHVLCQTAGGLTSYKFARLFWSLEFTESHGARYRTAHCVADLTVRPWLGLSIESGGAMLETLLSLTTFSSLHLTEAATKTMLGCLITVIGVDYTGYYLNPINASNQTFGCHGVSLLEHIIIYWLGPMAATALGTHLHPLLMNQWRTYQKSSTRHSLLFSPSITFDELGQAESGKSVLEFDGREQMEVLAADGGSDLNHNVEDKMDKKPELAGASTSRRLRPRNRKHRQLNGH